MRNTNRDLTLCGLLFFGLYAALIGDGQNRLVIGHQTCIEKLPFDFCEITKKRGYFGSDQYKSLITMGLTA